MQSKIDSLNKEMQEESRNLLNGLFKDFLSKYDGTIKNVCWTQYTPYFSDGEPCEFSVYDLDVNFYKDSDDDEDGNIIYSDDSQKKYYDLLNEYKEWEKNPREYALKKEAEHRASGKSWDFFPYAHYGKSRDTVISEWKPSYYRTVDEIQELYDDVVKQRTNFPDLYQDFINLKNSFELINSESMKDIFGDHVKVIVSLKDGIKVIEYEHN